MPPRQICGHPADGRHPPEAEDVLSCLPTSAREDTHSTGSRRVPLCIPCIRVPRIHAVLPVNTAHVPSSRPEGWRIDHTRRLARLRLRHQRAHPAHRSLSRRRGRDAAEMRPRCSLYGERCRRGKPLSPPPSRRCRHMTPGHSIDTRPPLTPSPSQPRPRILRIQAPLTADRHGH